jgi:hypothetical protein
MPSGHCVWPESIDKSMIQAEKDLILTGVFMGAEISVPTAMQYFGTCA